MSLFRDTAQSATSSAALTGSRLLLTMLLARALAPADYGRFVFIQWIIDLLFTGASFGLPGVLTRFMPQLAGDRDLLRTTQIRWLLSIGAVSLVLGAGLFLVYLRFDRTADAAPTIVLLGWCLSSFVAQLLFAALQGSFRYDAVMAGNLAFALVAPGLALALFQRPSLTIAAGALGSAWLAAILAALAVLVWRKPASSTTSAQVRPDVRQIISYGANVWMLGLLANLVWSRGEFGVLRFHVGSAGIAVYAAALSLTGVITQGCALLTGALTPHLVRHWSAGDLGRVETILRATTKATLLCAALLALVLTGFGRELAGALLGKTYQASYPVLCVLAVAAVSITAGSANTLLQIITNGRFGLLVNLVGLLVLLGVSLLLTPAMGIVGAAIARALAQMITAVFTFRRLIGIPKLHDVSAEMLRAIGSVFAIIGAFTLVIVTVQPDLAARLAMALVAFGAAVMTVHRLLYTRPFASLALTWSART